MDRSLRSRESTPQTKIVYKVNIVDIGARDVYDVDKFDGRDDTSAMERHSLYGSIGEALTRRRRELRKTQAEIASSAGLSRPSLANIEAGRQTLSLHQLYRLASVLEMEDVRSLLPPRLAFNDQNREETNMGDALPKLQTSNDIPEDQQERLRRMVAETIRKKK